MFTTKKYLGTSILFTQITDNLKIINFQQYRLILTINNLTKNTINTK
jgi:hypothetical protein